MIDTLPTFVPPMLAVRAAGPFDAATHVFEPKWDGIRCIFRCSKTEVRIFTRSGRDITRLFPEIAAVRPLNGAGFILDGELICPDAAGRPVFDRVRRRLALRRADGIRRASLESPASYVIFDLLYVHGLPTLTYPLESRRHILEAHYAFAPHTLLSPATVGSGTALYEAIVKHDLEGIVAKERSSPYLPGRRSRAWLKIRRTRRGVFWIIGFVVRSGDLRSLALADDSGGRLAYAGHVGSGLDRQSRQALLPRLRALPPLDGETLQTPLPSDGSTVWVTPRLACTVEYLERSDRGILRHPVFCGLVWPQELQGGRA